MLHIFLQTLINKEAYIDIRTVYRRREAVVEIYLSTV